MADIATVSTGKGSSIKGAVNRLGAKSAKLGAIKKSSEQWSATPVEIRERAFFTANVSNIKAISAIQNKIGEALSLSRKSGVPIDRNRFIIDMKEKLASLGYPTGGSGLTDITSNRRLKLIYDMNVREAQGFARYKKDVGSKVALNMYPAYELVRKRERRQKRNWQKCWADADKALGYPKDVYRGVDGRLIALKTSKIWKQISAFGRPHPPFDFNSGMGLKNVRRSECIKLKLIKENEILEPIEVDFNSNAKLSIKGVGKAIVEKLQLKGIFGRATDTEIEIRPNEFPVSDALDVKITDKELRAKVEHSIRVINSVHGDGELPVIPVIVERSKKYLGSFNGRTETINGKKYLKATNISMKKGEWTSLTTAHEIGHFLDGKGLDKDYFASHTKKINGVMNAIFNSPEYLQVKKYESKLAKKYWSTNRECFARAYAQFIAIESNDELLLRELDICRKARVKDGIEAQWSNETFKPIHKAIRELFKEKGWLR